MLLNKLPVHLPTMEETAQGRFGACPAAAFFPVGAQLVPTDEVRRTKAGTLKQGSSPKVLHTVIWLLTRSLSNVAESYT